MNKMLREKMLAYIDGLASNDDLMKLCSILRNGKDAERLTIAALNAFVPVDAPELESEVPTSPERANVNPGKSTITKIGTETKQHIFNSLANNDHPGPKYVQHLKLLWERGEIKFDGQEFYK